MNTDNELIYVYDALCGWCYGFSGVMKALHDKYNSEVTFTVLSGGMITGDRIAPIAQMADYIRSAIPRLVEMTGAEVSDTFINGVLDKGTYISNSEIPGMALTAFRQYKPEGMLAYASAIQRAFYVEGRDLNEKSLYAELARNFGVNDTEFVDKMTSDENRYATQEEFSFVAERLGVQSFPCLFFRSGEQWYLIAKGYRDFASLDSILAELLQKHSA